jgi:hypothetical protein
MKLLQMTRSLTNAESMNAGVLPQVWATDGAHALACVHAESATPPDLTPTKAAAERERSTPVFRVVLAPQTAFYRTYTEAMLRRYGVLSLESGRVPSLLGREMFRGKVTHYRVHAFDDVVIFVHDVERCIRELTPDQQRLIVRIGVQEYTFAETAAMLRLSLRSVQRRYFEAVDELTSTFLERRLLERVAGDPCQEGGGSAKLVSHTP